METTALRKAIRYGSGCAVILALGAWLLSPERAVHGLVATYFTTPGSDVPVTERVERVAMVSSNDTLIDPTAAFRVEWRGFLWSDGAALTFRVPDKGLARLVIDGQEVFDTANVADHTRRTASVQLSAGSHSVAFAIEKEVADKSYFSAALQTQGPLGEQLLSAARLYPQEPDAATALHELRNAAVRRIAGIMILLAALAAGLTLWRPRADWWRSRDMWLLVTLVALACLLRWLYLRDLRVSLPNYQVLPPGSDHRGYIANGRDFVRGLWPPANNFYVQPGLTWISGQLQRVFSDGAQALRIMQALLSSMAVIGVYHISRLVFDRPAARLGAFVWAIAPVPIFFDAQPLTHSLEALLVIVVLALWLYILDTGTTNGMHKRAGLLVAALGAMLGAAAVVRPSFLAFIPLVIATLLWQYRRTKIGIALACIVVAAASLPVLPVTLHNYRTTGRFQLISSNGPVTLYIGNNRDSAGIGEYSPAYLATHELVNRGETSYVSQTWDDIQSQPLRWLGLLVRKTALYFAAGEIPNNVDFYSQGIAASNVLAQLPSRFGVLQPLALAGLALAISRRRSLGVYVLVGAVGLLALSAIAFHVVSRFRVPLYGPYAVLGGFTLASLIGEIRRRNARDIVTLLSIVGSVGLAQSALPWVAEHSMARPVMAALPETAVATNATTDGSIQVMGSESPALAAPGEPMFFMVYYQKLASEQRNLYGSVQLIDSVGQKLGQVDQALGTGSFPDYPYSEWRLDEVVRDQFLLFAPNDIVTPAVLDVLMVVYDRDTGERIAETWLSPVAITTIAQATIPSTAVRLEHSVGLVELLAADTRLAADQLEITLYWQVADAVPVDGVVFIHLYDGAGNFVQGNDSEPLGGRYPMSVWQPGETIVDEHRFVVSVLARGAYSVHAGIYDPVTGERFPVTALDGQRVLNDSLEIGQVQIP